MRSTYIDSHLKWLYNLNTFEWDYKTNRKLRNGVCEVTCQVNDWALIEVDVKIAFAPSNVCYMKISLDALLDETSTALGEFEEGIIYGL